jgi:hypothetical protein
MASAFAMSASQIVKQQSTNLKRGNEMSTKQRHPRQDRRGGARAVVTQHANAAAPCHDKGNVTGGFGSAPNAKANAAFNAQAKGPATRKDAGGLVAAKIVTPQ